MTLADLRRLDGEATAGPWTCWERGDGLAYVNQDYGADPHRILLRHEEPSRSFHSQANKDTRLVVAARNSLGALLDVAEAAKAVAEGQDATDAGPHSWPAMNALRAALARLEGP